MKPFIYLLCVTWICFILSGCGNDNETGAAESWEVDTLTLVVTDTLGVMVGDSTLMFGSISGASFDRSGNIVVLDAMKARLSVFSPELDLITIVGRKGSGPGEFLLPRHFTILSDGGYAVSDWGANTVSILDSSYSFTGCIEGFYPMAPASPVPGLEGTFVAGGMKLQPADTEIGYDGSTFVGLFHESSEPVLEYASWPLDITVSSNGEETSVSVENVDTVFDTDPFGNVYITVRSDSTYKIDRYAPDGIQDLTIEQEWTRIAKTEEELQQTILMESHSRGGDGSTSAERSEVVNPYPWHDAISVLKTDDSGNLWVGQGYTQIPTFHVYAPHGELIQVVTVPELDGVTGLDWSFKGGLLGYDYAPEDYPKVYLLQPRD